MPKECYRCNLCSAIRDTKQEAEDCEKLHVHASVVNEVYLPCDEYPRRLRVVMADGKTVVYDADKLPF